MSLLAVVGAAGPTASEDKPPMAVTKLRGEGLVPLFNCNVLSKPGQPATPPLQVAPRDFRGPWTAQEEPGKPMYLRVTVNGEDFCVKKILVETNTAVPATNNGKECRESGGKSPRPGFSRGVGGC